MDATEVLLNTLEPNVGGVAGIQYTYKITAAKLRQFILLIILR